MAFKNARIWLLVTAWWTLHGLILAIEGMTMRDAAGVPLRGMADLLTTGLASGWMWVPLTLGLFAFVERFPMGRGHLVSRLALHTAAVIAVVVARGLAVYLLDPVVNWYPQQPQLHHVLVASLLNNFLTAWLIIGVAHALLYHRRARERELQSLELESKLVVARLQALQNQLNPHFLFNALNSVSELVHHCPESADRMLVSLGRILRENLKSSGTQEVPLREELSLLEQYVELEKLRLAERLRMHWEIDRSLLDARVPRLLLQPLVENAIRHAISRRTEPGRVTVAARRLAGCMLIEVRDDGAGLAAHSVDGIGLANTRERLLALYGDGHSFQLLRSDDGTQTIARIRIPIREAEAIA